MPTQWRVGILGNGEDLERLRIQLAEGPVRVVRDGDEFGVEMDEFQGLREPSQIFERVKEILPTLNGCL